MTAASPRVTISLVTYNGMRWLPHCVATVLDQTFIDFELHVLDNASSDGSLEWLRGATTGDPRITVSASTLNLGYAAGHNRQIAATRGEFVLLLNQDMELDAGFLAAAVAAFKGRPTVGAVQGRILRLTGDAGRSNVIDSTGLVMFRDRRVVARRQGEPEAARDRVPGFVWGVDGPAPVYRREALMAVVEPRTGGGTEVLDEDFFMYKEDVDLAWRLRRSGWQTWYEPNALAWHARGAGGGSGTSWAAAIRSHRDIPRWIKALSWRNQRLMQLKNDTASEFLRDLPWIARREIASLAFMLATDPSRLAEIARLTKRTKVGAPSKGP